MDLIIGLPEMSVEELKKVIDRGAKFVVFRYTVSLVFVTTSQVTNVYFVPSNGSGFVKGFKFSLLTMLLGWWSIPRGPFYALGSLFINLKGGNDVTASVFHSLGGPEPHLPDETTPMDGEEMV